MRQDVSGKVFDRVLERMMAVMGQIQERIDLGPTQVEMSPDEVSQQAVDAGPQALQMLQDRLTPEQLIRIMQLATNRPSATSRETIEPSQDEGSSPVDGFYQI